MSFPRYPKYKPSGVEWLGDVPEHWEVLPLRKLASDATDSFTDGDWIEAPFITDDGVRLLQTGNIGIGAFKEQGFRYISEESFRDLACTEVRPGDVLICRLAEPVGRACLAPNLGFKMITSVDVCIMKLSQETCPPFVVYLMSSAEYLGFMEGQCRGGTRDRVSRSFLAGVRVSLPHVDEQRAIAEFLDRETAKIDGLIVEQEKLIELLAEKRQAVISHAVTKGLDPAAPLKPSGVEWLGDVPEHWEVKPIRKAARLESGHTPSRNHPEYWENCTVPWFTLADVWQIREARRDIVIETKELISEVGLANSAARRLPAGTVMLSRTASVGFSAIMGVEMATTQDFANWVCGDELLPKFLLHAFRSMQGEFRRLMMGSTHNTIYMPDIQAFRFALPPLTEQRAIAEFLDRETAKIDRLVSEAEKAIELLRERRSALISAAVTGQIDVRGIIPESVA